MLAKSCPHLIMKIEFGACFLSFRSRMGVKQTSSHSSEAAKGLPCSPLGWLLELWTIWKRLKRGNCTVWDNLRAVKPSWAHEQLQHCLPCVHNPEQDMQRGPCPWQDKTFSTPLPKSSELLWQPDWPAGDQLTMVTTPGAGTTSTRSLHWWHFTSQATSS